MAERKLEQSNDSYFYTVKKIKGGKEMSRILSIDVGSQAIKGINDLGEKVKTPTVIATRSSKKEFFNSSKKSSQHQVKIINAQGDLLPDENKSINKTIGEAALRSKGATMLSRDKPDELHDIFVLATAYLLGAEEDSSLVLGLPYDQFKTHRQRLIERFKNHDAWVSVNEKPLRRISFKRVDVYPQGLGVILKLGDEELLKHNYIGVIEGGGQTTEIYLFEIDRNAPPEEQIMNICSETIEAGTAQVYERMADAYKQKTGMKLLEQYYEEYFFLSLENKTIKIHDKEISLIQEVKSACKDVASHIQEKTHLAWGHWYEQVTKTVCVGGSSIAFKEYYSFNNIFMPDDPVYAVAESNLTMLKEQMNDRQI